MEHEPKQSTERLGSSSPELEVKPEQLEHQTESTPEQPPQNQQERAEAARGEIKQHDESNELQIPERAAAPVAPPSRLDKLHAYRATLSSLQSKLTPSSRRFSRLIHQPVIEKASDVLESTIARPSVTLGATATAAIVGGVLYFTAKSSGFALSGSEFILSLLVGAILGIIIEALLKLLRNLRSH